MKLEKKTQTILLFIILIAIGGIVMYGGKQSKTPPQTPLQIKGPSMPPPGYATPR
jgi:hypothetical protein